MIVYSLLAAILTIVIIRYFLKQRLRPPGPWGLPVLGCLLKLDPIQPYRSMTKWARKYGPIYGFKMGSVYTVVLSDPEVIRKALSRDEFSGRAPLYVTHGIMRGYGLICAEGEIWKEHRKFVASTLRKFGMVKEGSKRKYLDLLIQRSVQKLIENIQTELRKNEPLNPAEYFKHHLGNTVNSLVFGLEYSAEDPTWQWLLELQDNGTKIMGVSASLNFFPWLRFLPSHSYIMKYLLDGKNETHKYYKNIISEYKENAQKIDDLEHVFDDDHPEVKHFIEAFIKEKEKQSDKKPEKFYCDEQFLHLLADIFGASLDTTFSTLRWFLLFMATNVDIQTKLQEEMALLVENVSLDDQDRLPLTQAALAETQRIRSVTPLGIPHGTMADTVLEGYSIPKGTMVIPLLWAVHMDPAKWENPEIFNPYRFLDQNGTFRTNSSFIPFQAGQRRCVGDELGRMLLFLYGASIVQRFKIRLPKGVKADLIGHTGITLTPSDYYLVFEKNN